jgi:hypothetical protein
MSEVWPSGSERPEAQLSGSNAQRPKPSARFGNVAVAVILLILVVSSVYSLVKLSSDQTGLSHAQKQAAAAETQVSTLQSEVAADQGELNTAQSETSARCPSTHQRCATALMSMTTIPSRTSRPTIRARTITRTGEAATLEP